MRQADDAHEAINNRQYTVAVMVDLEKGFDLVWHRGLLYKMENGPNRCLLLTASFPSIHCSYANFLRGLFIYLFIYLFNYFGVCQLLIMNFMMMIMVMVMSNYYQWNTAMECH